MSQTVIAARVEPELAEAFTLAAKLDGTTASGAMRSLMREYVCRVTEPLNDAGRATRGMESAPAVGSNQQTHDDLQRTG